MLTRQTDKTLEFAFPQRVVSPMWTVFAAHSGLNLPPDKDLEFFVALQTTVFINRHMPIFKT